MTGHRSTFRGRRVTPAVYVCHEPTIRRLVYVSKTDDLVCVNWRLPDALGALAARLGLDLLGKDAA